MTHDDLHAYLERIGWEGSTTRSYDTLAGLLVAHMSAIPFENLDVLLGRGVRLDLEGLQAKLVGARRGGYCFEHATLFRAVLDRLGFEPVAHLARVLTSAPRSAAARTHMFLTIALPEGRFALDPGFGGLAPRFPVPVVEGRQPIPGGATHWFERDGGEWTLKIDSAEGAADCWVSTLEPENPVDFAVANHYTATYPGSPFVNRLMMRALLPDGRVALHNRDVTVTRGGATEVRQLPDRGALRELVAEHFGFDLPEIGSLRVPTIPEWN